ncbi:MAG: peptide ABC transporter permease [Phycisphaeraceae bacterium]|nr:peptide ABC transporter permease [Phycisphaeraceae bacterium]
MQNTPENKAILCDPNPDEQWEVDEQSMQRYTAGQLQMVWWKFRKHRMAVWSGLIILVLYLMGMFCEFLAPYPLETRDVTYAYAPPQRIRFVAEDGFHLRPFVYPIKSMRDPVTLQRVYVEDRSRILPLRFFMQADPYHFWNLIPMNRHLVGVEEGGTFFLLGTDSLGRDLFSRILYGARISLTIGLIGVTMSFVLGLIIGAISGYYGGWIDNAIQRVIEIIRSFPAIPLWMALAAALPATWSPLQVYFGITIVLSFIGWTGLARQVRGKILSLREEDYATAAKLCGTSEWRIMTKHLLPAFMSHIVVSLSLAVPGMILGETALSFLGLGLRPPITSWGVLLKEAQNIQSVALHPWLLTPVVFVIIAVLSFNFVGDGLRDAADPYSR